MLASPEVVWFGFSCAHERDDPAAARMPSRGSEVARAGLLPCQFSLNGGKQHHPARMPVRIINPTQSVNNAVPINVLATIAPTASELNPSSTR